MSLWGWVGEGAGVDEARRGGRLEEGGKRMSVLVWLKFRSEKGRRVEKGDVREEVAGGGRAIRNEGEDLRDETLLHAGILETDKRTGGGKNKGVEICTSCV